jgi:glycosyltransferase involved in cell wall biosynthesis
MRIVFCWMTCEGYFAACWKQLARLPGIELVILALHPDAESIAPHEESLLSGLSVRLFTREQLTDREVLLETLASERPDVVVVPGIANPAAHWAVRQTPLRRAAVVMAWDTPWRGTLRQVVGRWVLGRRLKHVDHVIVPGERAWQCVRRIGFPETHISRGMYGIDSDVFALDFASEQRPRPRAFGYVGRYVQSKGIEDLAAAYEIYCRQVRDPWPLLTCGRGPLKTRLEEAGAQDHGFLAPRRLKEFFARVGVAVQASRFEPWGQAIVEACAAGLPVICTEACGCVVEMVRPFHNGLLVPTSDPPSLARAMQWAHEHEDRLAAMGARSTKMAQAYSSGMWAQRWRAVAEKVVHA